MLKYPDGGIACYCGFRPRDDQSASLGYETRTLFEILNACNAYPSTGKFVVNDNPSYLSRTGEYFVSSFPNSTTMVVHYRHMLKVGLEVSQEIRKMMKKYCLKILFHQIG